MQRAIRLKLDATRLILELCLGHPESASLTIIALVARLERLLELVRTLLARQLPGRQESAALRTDRDRLANAHRPRLTSLIRLGQLVAAQEGDSAFRIPESRVATSPGPFLQRSTAILPTAMSCRAALVRYGMPAGLLEEMQEELAACDTAHARAVQLDEECAAAGLEVDTVAATEFTVIRHLDALNHLRFAADPVRLDEWERTATVTWPAAHRQRSMSANGVPAVAGQGRAYGAQQAAAS